MKEKENGRKVYFGDENRTYQIFKALGNFYDEKQGVFGNVVLPQDRWPPKEEEYLLKDDRKMANWLFYVALPMRGGIISEEPFKVWWRLMKGRPELFNPDVIARGWWTPEKIEKIINLVLRMQKEENFNDNKEFNGYKIKEHAGNWYHNSEVLVDRWGGDVRNIFSGVKDFEEAFARVDIRGNKNGLKGMRRKIFSLLTIWLQEKELIPVFPTPIPVDFHALRVLWATEIIDSSDWVKPFNPNDKHSRQLAGKASIRVDENFVDQVAIWSQGFLAQSNLSHLSINPALWFLSRTLCASHFQNSSRKNSQIFVETDSLKSNPHLWPKNYKNPCLYCLIEKYCKWAIPAGPYYRWGLLIRLGRRVNYPQLTLPFNDNFLKRTPPIFRKNQK